MISNILAEQTIKDAENVWEFFRTILEERVNGNLNADLGNGHRIIMRIAIEEQIQI